MGAEQERLTEPGWKKWGPYVSDRQWGTVREDYSANGDAWSYITHDMARSKAYRWGEDGIAGISDDEQLLCSAVALWNKKDPIIKERYFGLSNPEGNHGEDVKELYYYLDSTPTHSYMKMLYKYPQQAYPYSELVEENKRRGRNDPEYELLDTGIFNNEEYFDVFIEYAKADLDDLLIRITIKNHASAEAKLSVLPTLWFRNTWAWGYDDYKPKLTAVSHGIIDVYHRDLGQLYLVAENASDLLFCENETNSKRLHGYDNGKQFCKDGINDHVVTGANTVNPQQTGTKVAVHFDITVPAQGEQVLRLRLCRDGQMRFAEFDEVFNKRKQEADVFYEALNDKSMSPDLASVKRQAFAGMLWSKQFYYYNIHQWLNGDPAEPAPPVERLSGRNSKWEHFNTQDIISMPDKWEYPWFASWDLAFHCLPLAMVDMAFAKRQLLLLTRDWYMHPNGQLPAYEWNFGDANPPVHAMAVWKVYKFDKYQNNGEGDIKFLERVFHKLMLNFTWWVNRKDALGNNIFEGGFLGLDNIGVFDRNMELPLGQHLEQADGTSWMAMYTLNLLRIATELTLHDAAYEDIASKFFEHFIYIAGAMSNIGSNNEGLWDDEDGFFYDQLHLPDNFTYKMKVRSAVGLIPLFANLVIDDDYITNNEIFSGRLKWFTENRPDLAALVSRFNEKNTSGKHLISLLRGYRMKALLKRMLDANEFLSDFGVRSLSRYHLEHPYRVQFDGHDFEVKYNPAESDSGLFGGNSNWRGPVWMPLNYMIVDSLRRFHEFYGDDYKVECPVGSGNMMNLKEVADMICQRLLSIFIPDHAERRPVYNGNDKLQTDAGFSGNLLFFEYFDGDTGKGLGASHQTGWTGLVVNFIK